MKEHVFWISFLIIILLLVAGCSSSDNQPITPSQQNPQKSDDGSTSVSSLPDSVVATRITIIPNTSQQQVSLGSLCGELVTCGDLPASSGIAAVPSTRCAELNRMTIRHDKAVIQCFMNSYQGTTDREEIWNIEYIKVLCSKGIGSRGHCEKYGVTKGEKQSV